MANLIVGDITPRVQYTATSGQTVFAYAFPIFADADLKVYIGSTLKTLTTHFTVSGAVTSSGGNVTLVTGATTGDIVTIYRDLPHARSTDFQTSGDLLAETLNDQLDKLVMMTQQNEQSQARGLLVNQFDDYGDLTLPDKASRVGKVLAFNATSGDPEGGPTIGDVSSIAAITADIATLADIEDGTDATDAIQTVAGISANVTTVAGVSSDVSTVANATYKAQVETVADDLNESTSEIDVVATNIANVNLTGGSISSVNLTGGSIANVNLTGGSIANVNTTAGSIANVNTCASNISAITAAPTQASNAASSASAASTSATNSSNSATAAASSATAAASSSTSAASSSASAVTAKTAAEAAQAAAELAADNFDDIYLGAKSSDPTVDNDGDALTAGDMFFLTTTDRMRVYSGSAWADVAIDSATVVSKTSATGSAILPASTTANRDGSPTAGYFRWNTTTTSAEIYDGSAWVAVGGGNTTTEGLWEHAHTISSSYSIASTANAVSAGSITINSGVTVTVPATSTWVIV